MKARPILFSGVMVRALLAGTKTQTRRIVKGDKPGQPLDWLDAGLTPAFTASPENGLCPYGYPGDLLWVKERLARAPDLWTYVADGAEVGWPARGDLAPKRLDYAPSIHMPKAASRLTLEITDVRVERLNEIDDGGAMTEGIELARGPGWGVDGNDESFPTARAAYRELWQQINGPGTWDANPWVWAVSFQVHRQNVDALIAAQAGA